MNKFRKQLKRCNMETEFKNWMTNLEKTWSVGARIELIENLSTLDLKKGDLGTIVRGINSSDIVDVKFDLYPDSKLGFYTSRMRLI